MRKILMTSIIAVAGICLTQSCGKAVKCVTLISNVTKAAQDFSTDSTKCADYKKAMTEWIDGCGGTDATQKAELQAAIDSLKC
jgi:hypothetical protein